MEWPKSDYVLAHDCGADRGHTNNPTYLAVCAVIGDALSTSSKLEQQQHNQKPFGEEVDGMRGRGKLHRGELSCTTTTTTAAALKQTR